MVTGGIFKQYVEVIMILYYTILYYTILYYTILYYTSLIVTLFKGVRDWFDRKLNDLAWKRWPIMYVHVGEVEGIVS